MKRMKMLKKEINTIYAEVTGDSGKIDGYDGSMDGGNMNGWMMMILAVNLHQMIVPWFWIWIRPCVYGSGYDSYEEDERRYQFKGGSSESADLIDILVQKD